MKCLWDMLEVLRNVATIAAGVAAVAGYKLAHDRWGRDSASERDEKIRNVIGRHINSDTEKLARAVVYLEAKGYSRESILEVHKSILIIEFARREEEADNANAALIPVVLRIQRLRELTGKPE